MASHQVSNQSRRHALAKLDAMRSVDVLIVGAGINGAGSFRELCLNGVTCLIVDREDFGAGATNASSRIAHGGLRYLETGQLRLVAEATLERNRLLQNAPHYVKPLLITIPSFSRFGGVLASTGKLFGKAWPMHTRGIALVKTGLVIYDWLGRKQRSLPLHRIDGRRDALAILPDINPAIAGMSSYYDARITHTERLAFELVQAGLDANPAALAVNHVALCGLCDGGVLLRDEGEGREFTVRPKIVVNASGAWIDDVNTLIGQADHLIGGTKGSHVMVQNETLRRAMAGRAFSFDDGEGRMCVAYEAFGLVMLGTSDIRVAHADDATCSEEEIAYFLEKIRIVFPKIAVRRDEVKYTFVGVRPLPQAPAGATVNISRDHSFKRHDARPDRPFPTVSLIGGKWTTFRAFSEQTADRVLAELKRRRTQSTAALPIGGGRDYPRGPGEPQAWIEREARTVGMESGRMRILFERYGTTAQVVAPFCRQAGGDAPLLGAPDYSEGEIRYLLRREMAVSLLDVVTRRTTLALEGVLSAALLRQLGRIILEESGVQDPSASAIDGIVAPALAYFNNRNAVDSQVVAGKTAALSGQT